MNSITMDRILEVPEFYESLWPFTHERPISKSTGRMPTGLPAFLLFLMKYFYEQYPAVVAEKKMTQLIEQLKWKAEPKKFIDKFFPELKGKVNILSLLYTQWEQPD